MTAGVTRAPALAARWLGRVPYREALALQRALHAGAVSDYLVLLEHPHVYTLGRNADTAHLLVPPAEVGADLEAADRGGDVTYHGPGQIVAYPVLDLRAYGRDIHRYMRALEQSAIDLLATYGIAGERRPGTPGVWAGGDKIASVGVFVGRWVTLHGIAVNIDPDLSHFDLIHPCGLVGTRMTSVAALLGRPVPLGEAIERYVVVFGRALAGLTAPTA